MTVKENGRLISTWPPVSWMRQEILEPSSNDVRDMDAADDEDRLRSETCLMDES